MKVATFTYSKAELIAEQRKCWDGHDPGDEDEESWLTAPASPSTSLYAMIEKILDDARRAYLDSAFPGPGRE